MQVIRGDSINEILREACAKVMQGADVKVRGLNTKEISPAIIRLSHPEKRTLLFPGRGNNPFASLAETYWVLAGRNDMLFLKSFLPRCVDYSDDGETWRAGYGPRLRTWESSIYQGDASMHYVDQIQFVIQKLTEDECSRQAVINIWDPAEECNFVNGKSTKDFPCSNWLHFMVRDNKLNLTVAMRSNDAIFGLSGINIYEWTVLQRIIAQCLGIGVGQYVHLSDSLHVYERHYEKAKKIANTIIPLPEIPDFAFAWTKSEDLNMLEGVSYYEAYIEEVEALCSRVKLNNQRTNHRFEFEDIKQAYVMLKTFLGHYDGSSELMKLPYTDLKVSCLYWIEKNKNKRKEDSEYSLLKYCIEQAKNTR